MPRRYKTAQQLNEIIASLEKRILYTDNDGKVHYISSPTRTSIVDKYNDIINRETGRFRSYEDVKEMNARFEEIKPYTEEEYNQRLKEFQDSEIYKQLHYGGFMRYQARDIIHELKQSDYEDLHTYVDLNKLSNEQIVRMVSKAGRELDKWRKQIEEEERSNGAKQSRYDSTAFYDLLIMEYQEILEENQRLEERIAKREFGDDIFED